MIAVLFAFILGNTIQLQVKYDQCKLEQFKPGICKIQKKLDKVGK